MAFWRMFFGAFYSAPLYRSMRAGTGYQFGYSFLLVALTALLLTAEALVFFHRTMFMPQDGHPPVFEDVVEQVARQLPLMTLKDGELRTQFPVAIPIRIKTIIHHRDFDGDFATIDTTGATTPENMKTPLLISARDVVFTRQNETKIYALKQETASIRGPLVINRALIDETAGEIITRVHRNLAAAYLLVGLLGWIFFTLVFYILRMTMLLALGGAGLLMAGICSMDLGYAACLRLAALSFTPIAMLEAFSIASTGLAPRAWVLFAGGLVTLAIAMRASREAPLADAA